MTSTNPAPAAGSGSGSGAVSSPPTSSSSEGGLRTGSGTRRGEDRESNSAGATLAASAQASLMYSRPGTPTPPGDSSSSKPGGLQAIGSLHVGDRHASSAFNSRETVLAAQGPISPSAQHHLSVPGNPSPPKDLGKAPTVPHSGSPGTVEASPQPLVMGESRWKEQGEADPEPVRQSRRRSHRHSTHSVDGGGPVSSTSHADPSRGAPSSTDPMGPAAGVSEGNAADGRQRYVFEVHDVDNMGGTPSRLSISNANTGELVRSFDLPAGDSRITADLPPGEYTIEVQAGSRPEGAAPGNPDRFDNFSVNMFSAGATPAGGGDGASLGGGGSGGGGGGGSGP